MSETSAAAPASRPLTGAADPYAAIGVASFINCCSTRTVHGGSLMLPEVKAAMEAASTSFVNINELMEAAGARINALTGAPWGMVTCGSAAAIATATAAAMAGNDPVLMLRLPNTTGMRRKVLMPASHRFPYDQAIRMTGAQILEIASPDALGAVDPAGVAMIALVGQRELGPGAGAWIDALIAFGRQHGIPLLVDAASEHPVRPDPWLARGADLVVYSGGKFLRGPQTSGLLLGREDLVRAAFANSAPHRAFCRPMKVGKEDVIGLLTALECWFARDIAASRAGWAADLAEIAEAVAGIAGVSTEMLPPEPGDEQPQLAISIDAAVTGLGAVHLRRQLLAGRPRIMLDDVSARSGTLLIEPFSLQPGEAAVVGAAIAAALRAAPGTGAALAPGSSTGAARIDGDWELEIAVHPRPRRFLLSLSSADGVIRGSFTSGGAAGEPLTSGTVEGGQIEAGPTEGALTGDPGAGRIGLNLEAIYEAAIMTWRLESDPQRQAGSLTGLAQIGSTTPGTRGEVSYSQYGQARWQARQLRSAP